METGHLGLKGLHQEAVIESDLVSILFYDP